MHEVENIFKEVPKTSRTLMFTATMPGRINNWFKIIFQKMQQL